MWDMTEQILVFFQSRIKFFWDIKLMKAPMAPCPLDLAVEVQSRALWRPMPHRRGKKRKGKTKCLLLQVSEEPWLLRLLNCFSIIQKCCISFHLPTFRKPSRLEITGALRIKRATSTSGIQYLNRRFKQCFKLKLHNEICILSDIKAMSCFLIWKCEELQLSVSLTSVRRNGVRDLLPIHQCLGVPEASKPEHQVQHSAAVPTAYKWSKYMPAINAWLF